jgi:flagellar biosynthesis protein FliP
MKFLKVIFILTITLNYLSAQEIPIPKIDFNIEQANSPQEVALSLQILLLLTLLSMAPAIMLMLTSFTKIIIVFDFAKRALSLQNMPPNQVMVSLALFLTYFIMAPTLEKINNAALQPYLAGDISNSAFFDETIKPLKSFMIQQIGKDGVQEVALFIRLSKSDRPKNFDDVPLKALIPAFMLTEIKKAFIIGIYLFIPFLVIDMVVASTLMSMGMIMLPPVMISLPFKIILFVLVDGWSLLTYELVRSYGG